MTYQLYSQQNKNALNFVEKQPCVIALKNSELPNEYKREVGKFIERNVLPDCGRVPPNCLKAHMIRLAKIFRFRKKDIDYVKNLFRGSIGYDGYYLDRGRLKRVNFF